MRVIAGYARGYKLLCVDGDGIRPTSDRVKEAIFSSIGDRLNGCRFLDLFSGSGAIGIEAMSRGAQFVCFNEPDTVHADILNRNIQHVIKAMADTEYKVIRKTALDAINMLREQGACFDIIFIDPPYGDGLYKNTLESIYINDILAPDGLVVLEASTVSGKPETDFFDTIKVRTYGKTSVYYMEPIRRNK